MVQPDLGGRRNKQHDVDPGINAARKNAIFKNYIDYTLNDAFESVLRVQSKWCSGLHVRHAMGANSMTECQWANGPVGPGTNYRGCPCDVPRVKGVRQAAEADHTLIPFENYSDKLNARSAHTRS